MEQQFHDDGVAEAEGQHQAAAGDVFNKNTLNQLPQTCVFRFADQSLHRQPTHALVVNVSDCRRISRHSQSSSHTSPHRPRDKFLNADAVNLRRLNAHQGEVAGELAAMMNLVFGHCHQPAPDLHWRRVRQ